MNYSSASYVNFTGLGSGIDTNSLVSGLMKVYSAPLTSLQNRQSALQNRLSVFSSLKGKMSDLQTAMGALGYAASGAKGSFTNSAPDVLKVTNTGNATGSFDFKVFQLAQSQKLSSQGMTGSTLGFGGTFTVNGKSVTAASTDSLSSLASKINSANAGVTANVINDSASGKNYLQMTSNTSGAKGGITLDDTSGDTLYNLGFLDKTNQTTTSEKVFDTVSSTNYSYSNQVNPSTGQVYGTKSGGTALEFASVGFSRWDAKLSDLLGLNSTQTEAAASAGTSGGTSFNLFGWNVNVSSGTSGSGSPSASASTDPDAGFSDVTNPTIEYRSSAVNGGASNDDSFSHSSGTITSAEIERNRKALRANMTSATGSDAGMAALDKNATYSLTVKDENGNSRTISYTLNDTMNDIAGRIQGASGANNVGTILAKDKDSGGNDIYRLQMNDQRDQLSSDGLGLFQAHIASHSVTNTQQLRSDAILTQGQDASYSVNGVRTSSASNTITNAIDGATVELLKADSANGAAATVGMTADGASTKTAITGFMDKFNSLQSFIKDNSTYNSSTGATGTLFGDSTTQQMQDSIQKLVFSQSSDTGTFKSLAEIGFGMSGGQMTFDSAKFDKAMSIDSASVNKLFKTTGEVTGDGLSYYGATSATQTGGPYNVNVSRVATQSMMKHHVDSTFLSQYGGSFKFSGSLFGDATVSVDKGATVQDLADKINSDSKLKSYLSASVDSNGLLNVQSKNYGSDSSFSIDASTDVAQAHSTVNESYSKGLDVAGTIGGKAATGRGQVLTSADGLAVSYAGSALGNIGTVKVTKGAGARLSDKLSSLVSDMTASFGQATKSTQVQIDNLGTQMTNLKNSLNNKEAYLKQKYNNMDQMVGKAQSQGQRLYAMIQGLSSMQSQFNYNSSSSSSGGTSSAFGV